MPFLENKPQPDLHLEFEWQAFGDLLTERQNGMGPGRIPWSAIDRYSTRYEIADLDEFERFARLMFAMDAAHHEHFAALDPPPSK